MKSKLILYPNSKISKKDKNIFFNKLIKENMLLSIKNLSNYSLKSLINYTLLIDKKDTGLLYWGHGFEILYGQLIIDIKA